MIFKDKQILYSILEISKKEIVEGLDEELEKYIILYDDNISRYGKLKQYVDLGFLAFSLLDNIEIEFEENIKNKLLILKYYIDKCIENSSFCKSNIFLAFVREKLGILLPKAIIYTNYRYAKNTVNQNANIEDNDKELSIMLFDESKIEIKKDYTCNNIIELIICSLYEVFNNNLYIKRCQNCGKYFISKINKKSVKYCNYFLPNTNETCRTLLNKQNYIRNRKDDILKLKYSNLISKYCNNLSRAENKIKLENIDSIEIMKRKKIKDEFKLLYKDVGNKVKRNEITKDEAIKILEKYDKEA